MTEQPWIQIVDWALLLVGGIMLVFLASLLVFFWTGMLYDMWKGGPEVRARWAEARRAVAAGWHPKRGKD